MGLTGIMARSVSNLVVVLVISSATASSIFYLREASAVGLELIARACWRVISSGSMSGGVEFERFGEELGLCVGGACWDGD